MHNGRIAIVMGAGALLVACSSESSRSGVEIRDSAGVRIIEHVAIKDLPAAFVIAAVPRLEFGADAGDPAGELNQGGFHRVARLSDGRFVVGDYHDLKVFDVNGRFLQTLGREGSGPGEFRRVRGVCAARGDTIVASHYDGPHISVFDDGGGHVRSFTASGGSYFSASGCFSDGTLLLVGRSRAESQPADRGAHLRGRVAAVRRIAIDGGDLGEFGIFPVEDSNDFFTSTTNIVPHAGHLYVGNGRAPEILVYGGNGELVRIIRWNDPLIPVTDELLEEQVRRSAPSNASSSNIAARLADARSSPQPATVPAYSNLQVDDAGRLWMQDHHVGSPSPPPWTVFDSAGRALGRVVLPDIPGAGPWAPTIRWIGEDDIVLSWHDDVFVLAHVSVHALERAPGR